MGPNLAEYRALDCAPGYRVCSLGWVENSKGRRIQLGVNAHGYRPTAVRINGVATRFLEHVLVAKAFIPNPEGKKYVNHINGDRVDNRAQNLEWATASENNARRLKPHVGRLKRKIVELELDGSFVRIWDSIKDAADATGYKRPGFTNCCRGKYQSLGGRKWKYLEDYEKSHQLIGEEWRPIPALPGRQVSNLGRIRLATGAITRGSLKSGYYVCSGHYSHRLVAEAFCPKKEGADVVNHIDFDKTNNRSDNLEWVTQQENVQHTAKAGKMSTAGVKNRQPVRCIAKTGEVQDYASITEAAKKTGVGADTISRNCKGVTADIKGAYWYFIDSDSVLVAHKDGKESSTSIDALVADVATLPIADDDELWTELGL